MLCFGSVLAAESIFFTVFHTFLSFKAELLHVESCLLFNLQIYNYLTYLTSRLFLYKCCWIFLS